VDDRRDAGAGRVRARVQVGDQADDGRAVDVGGQRGHDVAVVVLLGVGDARGGELLDEQAPQLELAGRRRELRAAPAGLGVDAGVADEAVQDAGRESRGEIGLGQRHGGLRYGSVGPRDFHRAGAPRPGRAGRRSTSHRRQGLDGSSAARRVRCQPSQQLLTGRAWRRRRTRRNSAEDGFDSVVQPVVLVEDGRAVEQTDATDGAPEDLVVMRRGGQGAHE
jgi:hypothetical protein